MERLNRTIESWSAGETTKVVLKSAAVELIKDHSRTEAIKLLRQYEAHVEKSKEYRATFQEDDFRQFQFSVRDPEIMLKLKFKQLLAHLWIEERPKPQPNSTQPHLQLEPEPETDVIHFPKVQDEIRFSSNLEKSDDSFLSLQGYDTESVVTTRSQYQNIVVAKEPVKPPDRISSWDDTSKLKLKETYKAYKRKCFRFAQPAVPIVELLSETTIYRIAEFRFAGDINQVTSEVIFADLDKATREISSKIKTDILDEIRKEVKFPSFLSDAEAQVETFIGSILVVLRMHSMQSWMDTKSNRKRLIKTFMCEAIPPAARAGIAEVAETGVDVYTDLKIFSTELTKVLCIIYQAERLTFRAKSRSQPEQRPSIKKPGKAKRVEIEKGDEAADLQKLSKHFTGILCVGCFLDNNSDYTSHFFDRADSSQNKRFLTCKHKRSEVRNAYLHTIAEKYWAQRKTSQRRKARKAKVRQQRAAVVDTSEFSAANSPPEARRVVTYKANAAKAVDTTRIEVGTDAGFQSISAILDSGYTGSLLLSTEYMKHARSVISGTTDILLADDESRASASWEGLLDIRISTGPTEFVLRNCPTLFVKDWQTGLIGEEILKCLHLMPEQSLTKRIDLNGRTIDLQPNTARRVRDDCSIM